MSSAAALDHNLCEDTAMLACRVLVLSATIGKAISLESFVSSRSCDRHLRRKAVDLDLRLPLERRRHRYLAKELCGLPLLNCWPLLIVMVTYRRRSHVDREELASMSIPDPCRHRRPRELPSFHFRMPAFGAAFIGSTHSVASGGITAEPWMPSPGGVHSGNTGDRPLEALVPRFATIRRLNEPFSTSGTLGLDHFGIE